VPDDDVAHVDGEVKRWLENLRSADVERIERAIDLYSQLEYSRSKEWLERMRAEDVERIDKAMKFYHRLEGAFWFNRWVIIILFSVFVFAAQFGEAVGKLFGWVRGAVK
jgi:hypothetical protein